MEGGDYKSVNPLGYVPALRLDDGTVLTEGPAIVQYIADQVPDKQLAPPNGTLQRTQLQSWLNFISSELHKGFSPLFNPAMPEAAKQHFRERLATRFQHLDQHLADKAYLLGPTFSVADAYLFTVSNWAAHTGVDLSVVWQRARLPQARCRAPCRAGGDAGGRPHQVGWPGSKRPAGGAAVGLGQVVPQLALLPGGDGTRAATHDGQTMAQHTDAPTEKHPGHPPGAAGHAIDDQQGDEDEGEHGKVDVKSLERGHPTPGAREPRLGS